MPAYTYDNLNRLTGIKDPDGHITSNSYDLLGNMTSTTDSLGNVTGVICITPRKGGF